MGLSRVAFGQKIGVSGDVINNIERGRVELKEPIIKLICSEFSVNENWIRNGIEPVFIDTSSSTMKQLKEEFNLDDFSYNLICQYLKLDSNQRQRIQEFAYSIVGILKKDTFTNKKQPQTLEELKEFCPSIDDVSDKHKLG